MQILSTDFDAIIQGRGMFAVGTAILVALFDVGVPKYQIVWVFQEVPLFGSPKYIKKLTSWKEDHVVDVLQCQTTESVAT